MNRNITPELRNTVLGNSKIDYVYFDKLGRHHFQSHLLPVGKDNPEEKLYAMGAFSHTQEIPGMNDDGVYEHIAKGNPDMEIVGKMFREEILDTVPTADNTDLLSKIQNSSAEDKAKFAEAILPPEMLEMLAQFKKMKSEQENTPKESVATPPPPPPSKKEG